MKKTEIAAILLIASVSMMVTFFATKMIVGDKIKHEATVKQAITIEQDVVKPSATIFNREAINPTVEVYVSGQGSAEQLDSSNNTKLPNSTP